MWDAGIPADGENKPFRGFYLAFSHPEIDLAFDVADRQRFAVLANQGAVSGGVRAEEIGRHPDDLGRDFSHPADPVDFGFVLGGHGLEQNG